METPVFINVIFVFFRVLQTHCCQLEFWSWREKKIPDSFNTKWFPDLFSAFPDLFRIFFRTIFVRAGLPSESSVNYCTTMRSFLTRLARALQKTLVCSAPDRSIPCSGTRLAQGSQPVRARDWPNVRARMCEGASSDDRWRATVFCSI